MSEYIYTGSKGEQIPVSKMQNSHLLNALLKKANRKAEIEGFDIKESDRDELELEHIELTQAVDAMKTEVLKRMPIQ